MKVINLTTYIIGGFVVRLSRRYLQPKKVRACNLLKLSRDLQLNIRETHFFIYPYIFIYRPLLCLINFRGFKCTS